MLHFGSVSYACLSYNITIWVVYSPVLLSEYRCMFEPGHDQGYGKVCSCSI